MTDYKLDSMFELRKFLWSELKKTGIFNPYEYYSDNLGVEIIPIIPVQQSPELDQFLNGKKHIVYDKIGISYEENWMICCEKILFTVYSTDISDIYEIRNLMTDLFRRMDESAKDLNYSMISDHSGIPGTSCNMIGATQQVNGVAYQCIKSGNKLIWGKGTPQNWPDLSFNFHNISLLEISPISPSEELQGFLSADIILEVKYSRFTGDNGRFA
jgi:hypothetical protein